MSKYEGFTAGDFGTSTRKRLPICFCLDVSGSMVSPMGNGGTRISELNRAFNQFITAMKRDENVLQSADVAVITFGGKVSIDKPFGSLQKQEFSRINVNERSFTPMGEAITSALKLLELRKNAYRDRGIKYFKPWIVIITDGEPEGPNATDNFQQALVQINQLERENKVFVFNVAIGDDCSFDNLKKLSIKNAEPFYVNDASDLDNLLKYLVASSSSLVAGNFTENDIKMDNDVINGNGLHKGKKLDMSKFISEQNDYV